MHTSPQDAGLEAKRCSGMCKARGRDVDKAPGDTGLAISGVSLPQDPRGVGQGRAPPRCRAADTFTDVLLIADHRERARLTSGASGPGALLNALSTHGWVRSPHCCSRVCVCPVTLPRSFLLHLLTARPAHSWPPRSGGDPSSPPPPTGRDSG